VNNQPLLWVALAFALVLASLVLPLSNGRTLLALLCTVETLANLACLRQGFISLKSRLKAQAATAFGAALVAAIATGVSLSRLL
jgi:hypothetical protein